MATTTQQQHIMAIKEALDTAAELIRAANRDGVMLQFSFGPDDQGEMQVNNFNAFIRETVDLSFLQTQPARKN